MKKRFIAAVSLLLFLIPYALNAAEISTQEDFTSRNAMVTADFQLSPGRLKNLLLPLLQKPLNEVDDAVKKGEKNAAKAKLLFDKFLAGDRFFVSGSLPESFSVSFPVNDAQWTTLTAGSKSHMYSETEVFSDVGAYFTKLDGFAIVGNAQEPLHQAIDLTSGTSTDSLSNNAAYNNVTKSYFSPRLLGFTLNIKAIKEVLIPLLTESADGPNEEVVKGITELISLFEWEGMSLAEVKDGYKFNFKIVGNPEKLKENGLSFNPSGNFKPSLYKKFPSAKPMLYTESFNPKANNEQSKKLLEILRKILALPEDTDIDIYENIKGATGAFDREFAIGLAHDTNSPIPTITIMANVSNNLAAGENFIADLVAALQNFLKEENVPKGFYKISTEDGFTKFTFDVMKIDDYQGPPFPPLVFSFGVNKEGMLIISNYSGDSWTGFNLVETGENTGIFYLNARNFWGWFDALAEWGERAGGGEHGPPLDFYQSYYSVLEKIYGWRDLLITSTATESEATITGEINIDQAKHKTYEQLIEEIKSSDRDGDGISDYEERYVYHTSVESVDDLEKLQKGFKPGGEDRLWTDVPEDAYYTDETSLLYQRGAIRGYDDGTFKPGQLVNRAEFTTMIVKSFEQGTSQFLGVDVELRVKDPPFTDLDPVAWYYPYISKAYAAGFISGSVDQVTNELKFRPGDNISRAEAIAILNKASAALTKTKPTVSCSTVPFDDVPSDAWFCDEIANAYQNGVTKGKDEKKFAPNEFLNRADAAVMIRRTLEKDISHFEEGTESFGELTQPLLPAGLGTGGGTVIPGLF